MFALLVSICMVEQLVRLPTLGTITRGKRVWYEDQDNLWSGYLQGAVGIRKSKAL